MSVIAEENVDEYNQPTEIESLCMNCYQNIVSKNLFTCGDSSTSDRTEKLKLFGQKMDKATCPADRTNKVKSGGATEELGTKITFHLTDMSDMSRDLLKIMAGDMDVHVVLDDPAGNRYLQNVYAPDPEMTTEKYTRTFEKNEDLGLNDMKTEGYQE